MEMGDGSVRVGFRCRPPYDVAVIATELGGGGHPLASGCTLPGPLAKAEALVIEKSKAAIHQQSPNPRTNATSLMLSGLLSLDKPGGVDSLLTSHDVVQRVRRLAGMRRVGHAGTLDPLASGVLLLCLGRTTRLIEYLVGLPKQYRATIRLGESTDTYDAQGEITEKRPCTATLSRNRRRPGTVPRHHPPAAPALFGHQTNGQPLYKLARQGIEVERPWRTITIHNLTIVNWNPPDPGTIDRLLLRHLYPLAGARFRRRIRLRRAYHTTAPHSCGTISRR
jgi:tRNA pseudouridine(55) synthase